MAEDVSFEEYLTNKKIDAGKFKQADPVLYGQLNKEFDQMHPNSFTSQKLFMINPLRRKFLLEIVPKTSDKPKAAAKPRFKKPI